MWYFNPVAFRVNVPEYFVKMIRQAHVQYLKIIRASDWYCIARAFDFFHRILGFHITYNIYSSCFDVKWAHMHAIRLWWCSTTQLTWHIPIFSHNNVCWIMFLISLTVISHIRNCHCISDPRRPCKVKHLNNFGFFKPFYSFCRWYISPFQRCILPHWFCCDFFFFWLNAANCMCDIKIA